MAPAVHFRDVVSLAGRFPLLTGASIDVAEGEVVHLRGPNGAGKTSLLRCFAGLIPIASGEAVVLGHDLRIDPRGVRREIGMVGHSTFLYDDLSVEDNLRFALAASGAASERAAGAIERLGLAGRLATTPVGRLSAGQRRRTALAVLLGRAPRLWLLDEPHAGLDSAGQDLVDELIAEARSAGVTVVIASHDLDRIDPIADRVVDVIGGAVDETSTEPTENRSSVTDEVASGSRTLREGDRHVA